MADSFAALLAEYKAEMWSMDAKRLEAFIDQLEQHNTEGFVLEAKIENEKRTFINRGGVAIIPIKGTLLKTVPPILRLWGFNVTGYDELTSMLKMALAERKVKSILLDVDSPGGQVAGGLEAANEIAAANKQKPLTSEVRDLGASCAYFLISQAGKIKATANSMLGSMGVFATYYDYSKMAESDGVKAIIIRSGEHKGMGVPGAPITDAQIAAMQEVIDNLANNFIKIVAKGRDLPITQVRELANGRVWLAKEAKDLGLIDGIIKTEIPKNIKPTKIRSNAMAENSVEMINEVEAEKVKAEGIKTGKAEALENFKVLAAAYPDEPGFVSEQFIAGADANAAALAHAQIVEQQNRELQAENKQLKADVEKAKAKENETPASGAPPVPHNEAAQGEADFVTQAKQMAKEENITYTKAASKLARERPELHQAYKAKLAG